MAFSWFRRIVTGESKANLRRQAIARLAVDNLSIEEAKNIVLTQWNEYFEKFGRRRRSPPPELSLLPPYLRSFFEEWHEVKLDTIDLWYDGRGDWVPKEIPGDLVVVGGYGAENYVWVRASEETLYEYSLDELDYWGFDHANKFRSLFHYLLITDLILPMYK